jgi:hypothetical protein
LTEPTFLPLFGRGPPLAMSIGLMKVKQWRELSFDFRQKATSTTNFVQNLARAYA